jgi:membrane-associated phospholipid phosphatase
MASSKAGLLARFSGAAAAVRKQSPIDPRSIPVLAFSLAVFAAEAAYIATTELSFPAGLLLKVFWLLILILAGGMIARHYGMTRIGNTLQATALAPISSALTVVATVILTRFSTTFSDDALAEFDRFLGLNWLAVFGVFQRHPTLLEIARLAYQTFYWQFIAIGLILFAFNRVTEGWRFINAWVIGLMASALIFPFFTAAGPYRHFGITPADIPNLGRDAPWITGPVIEAIRAGRSTDVIGSMGGLISFPSFHTAGAILYIWSCWSLRWIRIPVLIINIGLIASTPVVGAHYLIDLVGGIFVALGAILASNRLVTAIERRMAQRSEPGLDQGSQPAQLGS